MLIYFCAMDTASHIKALEGLKLYILIVGVSTIRLKRSVIYLNVRFQQHLRDVKQNNQFKAVSQHYTVYNPEEGA